MRYAIYLILWCAYTAIYAFLIFATLADGHGTFLFADTLIAWILFAVAVTLIPWAASKRCRMMATGFLLAYSLLSLVLIVIEQTGDTNFARSVRFATERTSVFLISATWFLIGQILAWLLLFRYRYGLDKP